MTREEAIARIKDHKIIHKMNEPRAIYISEALDMGIKALEQTTWIPVSEKTPPIAQRVLVSANNGEVFIARLHSFDKWTFEPTGIGYVYDKENIIAWMPLPQSYQGE